MLIVSLKVLTIGACGNPRFKIASKIQLNNRKMHHFIIQSFIVFVLTIAKQALLQTHTWPAVGLRRSTFGSNCYAARDLLDVRQLLRWHCCQRCLSDQFDAHGMLITPAKFRNCAPQSIGHKA
jgi:hypothetical protein